MKRETIEEKAARIKKARTEKFEAMKAKAIADAEKRWNAPLDRSTEDMLLREVAKRLAVVQTSKGPVRFHAVGEPIAEMPTQAAIQLRKEQEGKP